MTFPKMELFQTDDHYIIYDNEYSLWCCRKTGFLEPKLGSELATAWNPVCLGVIYGVIGKIQIHRDGDWQLLLIKGQRSVGTINEDHEVYCINNIAVLPLTKNGHPEIEIEKCPHHHFGIKKTKFIMVPSDGQKPLAKTLNAIKSATQSKKKEVKEKEKHERRVLEELHRMFADSNCFYYSPTGDLTNSLQRLYSNNDKKSWDERFFWNQHMLHDLFQCEASQLSAHWTIPVIQGYVQITKCILPEKTAKSLQSVDGQSKLDIWLMLISRRSKYRAGTRYRRRGIDEDGHCANFVETEQILQTGGHSISYLQVRGSIPVFWSQPGIKYRPPPRIDRDDVENQEAFKKHFEELMNCYKKVAIVTLLEQEGREEGLGDAFMQNVVVYNNPQLTYISFDFHEHCRGLHFENVSLLVDSIRHDIIKDQRYCWVDGQGTIAEQRGVFRVNCMDCLDRTNVIQTAFARTVLTIQLHKVGLLMPDETLPQEIRSVFQNMWANNGDILSQSYTGTAALKGDYTRTGERKISGMMKDGYHSANRYLTAQFKDAYRQLTVDILLGNKDTPEEMSLLANRLGEGEDETDLGVWTKEREESVQHLIQHCVRLLLPKSESKVYLGGWALICCDSREVSDDEDDMEDDIILLVTEEAYYVANYDDEDEKISQYERIPMKDMETITIGSATTFFGSSEQRCCRIHHSIGGEPGYFITLKDLPGHTKKQKEDNLQGVIHAFAIARAANNLGLKVLEGNIDRKNTKVSQSIVRLTSQKRLSMWFQDKLTRDKDAGKPTHPVVNHNRHPAITNLYQKPQKVQQVGKYIQTMGSKVTGLSLLKRIKLRKDSNQASLEGGLDNDAFEETLKDYDDVEDDVIIGEVKDVSSSTVTSTNSLSIGEYLDVCCHVDDENNFDRSLVQDGDINIPRVGDLATDPGRNSRSFSHRGVTPKKKHTLLDYGGTPEKRREERKQRAFTMNRLESDQEMLGSHELKRSDTQDSLDLLTEKGNRDSGVSQTDQARKSPSKRRGSNPFISVTSDEDSPKKLNVANGKSTPARPVNRRVHSLAVPDEVPLRSPVKSHSENDLLELSEIKGTELQKSKDVSDGSDMSSAGGSGFRKLTNQFRKFNLPISFTRTQRQNEKLKKSLEMRARCQSRFICL
ncbi:phosphatidylinositide phosphatase SAC2-like isoform X2 [Apostichopus japonicus]|uniref:phosphatidylinositide phosphatase SAC2-like isoform X2 n=1 Tax=Stichopus japonicus TaxID=307972 RepID=UPI003AB6CF5C